MTVAVAVLVAGQAAAALDAPLPEGNAYVRGLAARQRQRAEVLDTYTYDLVSVREDLDRKGRVTRRRTRTYETFFVRKVDGAAWLPVRDETLAAGRVLLLKRFRTRITRSYGNYRKFEVDVQEAIPP